MIGWELLDRLEPDLFSIFLCMPKDLALSLK